MNVSLRRWSEKDASPLAVMLNNRNILDNLRDGIPYPYTEEDAKTFIRSMLASDPNTVFPFAITAGNTLVGSIGAFRQENIHFRTAEIGYYIAQPYWGQGIASSAVSQLCRFLFEHTDIIRIYAEPFAYNAASCRVLEKSGFQCEGTLRKNAVKHGTMLDMKLYSRIKDFPL